MYYFVWYYFKAKLPLYGLGEALRVLDGWGSQIIWQSADEGEKVLSPVPRPPLPPLGNIPCTHFCERLGRPHGHSAAERITWMNFSMISSGIEPATFGL
jgi:hypothetical protein